MALAKHLQDGEKLLWQGRPAPRCFVFRNWKHSLFGLVLLIFGICWETMGINLSQSTDAAWLIFVPVPFILIGLYLSLGHLLKARLEWEKHFFAVTDQRLLRQRGLRHPQLLSVPVRDITYFLYKPLSDNVGSLRIEAGHSHPVMVFSCVEHPQTLLQILENIVQDNLQQKELQA